MALARGRGSLEWMSGRLERVRGLIGDVLNYPVIPTETRPITVITILVATVVVIAGFWISRRVQATLRRRVLARLHLEPGLEFSVLRFAHYAVLALALLFALQMLHVDLTGVAVVAGILGVGIGFGLQNLASNFISASSCSSSARSRSAIR